MSQQVDTINKSFKAVGAIGQYLLVKKTTAVDLVDVCGATDIPIGVAQNEAFAAGDSVTVRLLGAAPTSKMIADSAIVMGARVFTSAAGKVEDTSPAVGESLVGVALDAAAADGDIFEVATGSIGHLTPA